MPRCVARVVALGTPIVAGHAGILTSQAGAPGRSGPATRTIVLTFDNEGKLAMDERRDVNHTPIEKYEQDILDGEPVTLDLMGQPKLGAEPDPPKWVIDLYRQR